MGLKGRFDPIVGYEDTTEHKPAPTPFLACLHALGLPGNRVVAVGDTPSDILGARAAGIWAAAALWGASDQEALVAAGPDIVPRTPSDLVALIP